MAIVAASAILLVSGIAGVTAYAMHHSPDAPMTVSLFDSDGQSVVGDLLDEDSITLSTYNDADTGVVTYTIESLTPLISETRYLLISPDKAGDCTLDLSVVMNSGFLLETGIVFAFYSDTSYSASSLVGELTYVQGEETEQKLDSLLTAGKPYYIRAWTAVDYDSTEASASSHFDVDLTFTATTTEAINNVNFYANDGISTEPVEQRLVMNGQTYGEFPVVSKEGSMLVGWFTDPVLGEAVHPTDTVELTGEQNLYAHWLGTDIEPIHVETEDNDVWIWIDVDPVEETIHVKIDGESTTTRIKTVYDQTVIDGKVEVDTYNTATSDFTVQDAKDANYQYETVRQALQGKGLIVENYIVLAYSNSVSCEEGSFTKLLETDCNDYRVVGDDISISLDRASLGTLSPLTGETTIDLRIAPKEAMTDAQKEVIGDNRAYEIKITDSDGNEVESFEGIITAWFHYEAPANVSFMQVYCVSEDGTKEAVQFTYDNQTITFKTGHLSVYFVYVEASPSDGGFEFNWIPFAALGVIVAFWIIFFLYGKKGEEGENEAL